MKFSGSVITKGIILIVRIISIFYTNDSGAVPPTQLGSYWS